MNDNKNYLVIMFSTIVVIVSFVGNMQGFIPSFLMPVILIVYGVSILYMTR